MIVFRCLTDMSQNTRLLQGYLNCNQATGSKMTFNCLHFVLMVQQFPCKILLTVHLHRWCIDGTNQIIKKPTHCITHSETFKEVRHTFLNKYSLNIFVYLPSIWLFVLPCTENNDVIWKLLPMNFGKIFHAFFLLHSTNFSPSHHSGTTPHKWVQKNCENINSNFMLQ